MNHNNASLVDQWRHSQTAQGVALGLVLGPVGMLLAYLFSARDKREIRVFGALKGSLAAATTMLVLGGLLFAALSIL